MYINTDFNKKGVHWSSDKTVVVNKVSFIKIKCLYKFILINFISCIIQNNRNEYIPGIECIWLHFVCSHLVNKGIVTKLYKNIWGMFYNEKILLLKHLRSFWELRVNTSK